MFTGYKAVSSFPILSCTAEAVLHVVCIAGLEPGSDFIYRLDANLKVRSPDPSARLDANLKALYALGDFHRCVRLKTHVRPKTMRQRNPHPYD